MIRTLESDRRIPRWLTLDPPKSPLRQRPTITEIPPEPRVYITDQWLGDESSGIVTEEFESRLQERRVNQQPERLSEVKVIDLSQIPPEGLTTFLDELFSENGQKRPQLRINGSLKSLADIAPPLVVASDQTE